MRVLRLLLLLFWGMNEGYCQPGNLALNNDPVFHKVLSRRVSYPIEAIRSATSGRIYAGFEIDAMGHIQHINILSADQSGVGFENEIRTALKRMPPLNPRYAGRYVLPVAFVFTNAGENWEAKMPAKELAPLSITNRLLLSEVIFRGEIRSTSVYLPPNRDIRYY